MELWKLLPPFQKPASQKTSSLVKVQTPSRKPPMVLPTFEEGQNIYVFLDLFDNAAECYHWSDQDKMFFMWSKITGQAAELV